MRSYLRLCVNMRIFMGLAALLGPPVATLAQAEPGPTVRLASEQPSNKSTEQWLFDSVVHADPQTLEKALRARQQINDNELTAIKMCHVLVPKDPQTVDETPEEEESDAFAQQVLVTVKPGVPPVSYHGYSYRIVPQPPGQFLAVAWPVQYRASGLVTFAVGAGDVVYAKDLGSRTPELAQSLNRLPHDGGGWSPVKEPPPADALTSLGRMAAALSLYAALSAVAGVSTFAVR